MLHATKCGALDRLGLRIFWINLDDPAEAVDLVLIPRLRAIKTSIELVPFVAETIRCDAVTSFFSTCLPGWVGRTEVSVEVLFACEVGAPGGVTVGAVVQRTLRLVAGRILQQIAVCGWTAELHQGVHMDATVALVLLRRPTLWTGLDVENTDAMQVLRNSHFFETGRHRFAERVLRRAVLVVDSEHALSVVAEVVHAVVAETRRQRLLVTRKSIGEFAFAIEARSPR